MVTVEDPVEYQIDGHHPGADQHQGRAARSPPPCKSILRSDPDIVLIGEIRDADTATIAMEAALSGHLVLTTLHTNTAAATPLRLTEMGIEPFLVTSARRQRADPAAGPGPLRAAARRPYDASEKDFYAAGYREADLEGLDMSTLLPGRRVPDLRPHRLLRAGWCSPR